MSDAESNFSFASPSISPTFSFEQPTWSVEAQGESESSTLPQSEAEAEQVESPRARCSDNDEEATFDEMTRRAVASNGTDVEAHATTATGDASNGASQHQQRGRTHRKRSSTTQPYVCVVVWLVRPPPQDAQAQSALEQVQEIRRKHDNAYRRWEPHITLVPPFVVPFKQTTDSGTWIDGMPGGAEASTTDAATSPKRKNTSVQKDDDDDHIRRLADPRKVLSELSKRIARVCEEQAGDGRGDGEGLHVAFEEVSKFALRRYDTYHLRPSSASAGAEALAKLQRSLAHALPEAWQFSRGAYGRRPSQSQKPNGNGGGGTVKSSAAVAAAQQARGATDFKPHLTLGQAFTAEKGAEIEAQALALLDPKHSSNGGGGPFGVSLDAIQLMWKPVYQSGPYEVFQEFKLGDH